METGLNGKVALVTGAGRGIGREIAKTLAAQGVKVVVNDLGVSLDGKDPTNTPAHEVVSEIEDAGGQAVANLQSVTDPDAAREMIGTALDTFGGIDIVVNNAGILRDAIFHKMQDDDWEAVVNVHLNGSYYVSHAAAEHFRKQESGAFVHMTSTSGLVGNYGQANYMAAKLGIAGLSKAIALDMKRFGVRSNCISPFAWSRMVGSIPDDENNRERLAAAKSFDPKKVATFATFLASDSASDFTGQIFGVRANEIFLFSQPRPIRSLHRSEGWSLETLKDHFAPAMTSSLIPLDRSGDVFNWNPV